LSRQTIYLALAVVLAAAVVIGLVVLGRRSADGSAEAAAPKRPENMPTTSQVLAATLAASTRLENIPFDGAQAYEDLKQLVAIGPRRSGSPGMAAQQKLLAEHFQKLGGRVEFQRFTARHPVDRSEVPMANLIVRWQPDNPERILLCAHYDTLPFPMHDLENPRGVFVGANDNASGVALLMELGREMAKWPSPYGIDFVFFDAEEFIFTEQDEYFRGSTHFAQAYAKSHPGYRYRWGVLLDMVGATDLHVYQESLSYRWADTRLLVDQIWTTARRLGVREFISRIAYTVHDDHVPLHDIAKIPTCDLISMPYVPWHTQGDTVDKCSPLSLAKVGWVLGQWLKSLPAPRRD
jgi:hypothetical protein